MGQTWQVTDDEIPILQAFFKENPMAGFVDTKYNTAYVSSGDYQAFKEKFGVSPVDLSPPSTSQHLVTKALTQEDINNEIMDNFYQNQLKTWASKYAEVGNITQANQLYSIMPYVDKEGNIAQSEQPTLKPLQGQALPLLLGVGALLLFIKK